MKAIKRELAIIRILVDIWFPSKFSIKELCIILVSIKVKVSNSVYTWLSIEEKRLLKIVLIVLMMTWEIFSEVSVKKILLTY